MSKKIALFDMDGTLADFHGQMLSDLIPLMSPEEAGDFDIWNASPHIENRMRLIKNQPGWWRNLPQLYLGFDILEVALSIGFQIHVLTKGPWHTTSAWTEKVEWCREHLPKSVKVIITEDDKSGVYGRVLVDDYVPFMEAWLGHRPRGLGIMPIAKNNKDFKHDQVVPYDRSLKSLGAIKERLMWAFQREDGKT